MFSLRLHIAPTAAGPGPGGLPPPEAYAMLPDEKMKYDGLFATYDTDKSG